MPHVVIHVHFHQHGAGIEHALTGVLLAPANCGDGPGGNQHAPDLVLQTERLDARLQRLPHLALKAGIGVDDVPLHVRIARSLGGSTRRAGRSFRFCRRSCARVFLFVLHKLLHFSDFLFRFDQLCPRAATMKSIPRPITKSTSQKYRPKMNTVMITTMVVACTSFSDGVVTFFFSMPS